jgi:hypothetical protein
VKAITRLNGKPFDDKEWEVSPDGATYTYTQHNVGSPKPARIVLHRMDAHGAMSYNALRPRWFRGWSTGYLLITCVQKAE